MSARSGKLVLEIERLLPTARSIAWKAFTEPDQLAKWWGPSEFIILSLEFDARIGERYRIEMQPPGGDAFFLSGEFRDVAAPARLEYTFAWEDPDPDDVENLVRLTFQELGESTEVLLNQAPFKTEARRELHHDGWNDSFDKLEHLISRR